MQSLLHTEHIGTLRQSLLHTEHIGTLRQSLLHTEHIGTLRQSLLHTEHIGTLRQSSCIQTRGHLGSLWCIQTRDVCTLIHMITRVDLSLNLTVPRSLASEFYLSRSWSTVPSSHI